MTTATKDFLTKTEIKKNRGWTDKLIKLFLIEPDKTVPSPYKGAPIQLYKTTRVETAETSEEFISLIKKTAERRVKQSQAMLEKADIKRQELFAWVDSLKVDVPQIEYHKLIILACEHYNCINFDAIFSGRKNAATSLDDSNFLYRICHNYLRHNMTNYEYLLLQTFGKIGKDAAYLKIKTKVTQSIDEAYPGLKDYLDQGRTS